MVDVRVKTLEWVGVEADCYMHAGTTLGDYTIWADHDDEWTCEFEPNGGRPVILSCWRNSAAECKAAAQADYEQRIRSALSDAVAEHEAEPVAWQHRLKSEYEEAHWTEWREGKANITAASPVKVEERPLYTSPPTSELEALRKRVAELEVDVARERRRATDAEYFNLAYHNMLGPIAMKVAEMWREKNITRVHFDWGTDAAKLTGEERAQIILDFDKAPKQLVENVDEGRTARRVREGGKVE